MTIHKLRPRGGEPPAVSSDGNFVEQVAVLLLVLTGIPIWVWAIASAVNSAFGAATIRTIAMLE